MASLFLQCPEMEKKGNTYQVQLWVTIPWKQKLISKQIQQIINVQTNTRPMKTVTRQLKVAHRTKRSADVHSGKFMEMNLIKENTLFGQKNSARRQQHAMLFTLQTKINAREITAPSSSGKGSIQRL